MDTRRSRQHLPALLVLVALSWQSTCAFTSTVSRTASFAQGHVAYHQRLPVRDPRLLSLQRTRPLNINKGDDVNGSAPKRSSPPAEKTKGRQHFFTYIPRTAIRIYSDYASRLWRETSSDARKKVASDQVTQSIKQVQHVFRGEEYGDFSKVSSTDRKNLLDACDSILADNERPEVAAATVTTKAVETPSTDATDPKKKKKGGRSVLFGATMGAAVAGWVFSGNYVFTGLFTLMTILGQLEYYRMVMNTGVYPARRISIVGAASMFLTVRLYSIGKTCKEFF